MKRVAALTLQLPANATLGLLSIMTDILNVSSSSPVLSCYHNQTFTYLFSQKHPKVQQLLDNDHDGSGVFMPELNDPEHCNALASTLWEFALLKVPYTPFPFLLINLLFAASLPSLFKQLRGRLPQILRKGKFHSFFLEITLFLFQFLHK